jgi:DNA-binding CsgD family transcriptional regulator
MAILTDRQRQMLILAGQGKTVPQIAAELWVSEDTVKTTLLNARRRLGAKTTAQAIVLAFQAGELS